MRRFKPLMVASLLLLAAPAGAETCTVANASLAFGSYNPVSASPTNANTTVTVSCSELLGLGNSVNVSYTILLSGGNSGNTANRELRNGGNALPYNLYTSGSYATVWDNSTGVSGGFTLQGLLGLPLLVSASDSKTVYGRILAQRPAYSLVHSDSLVITVNY